MCYYTYNARFPRIRSGGRHRTMPFCRTSASCQLAFLNKLHEEPGLVALARRMDAELHVIEWAEPDPDVFGARQAGPVRVRVRARSGHTPAGHVLRPIAMHALACDLPL